MATVKGLHPAFQHNYYLFRGEPGGLFGQSSFVYDESEKLRLYSKRKSFILEGDFRVLGAGRKELLTIKTPQPLGAWTTCYVQDSTTGEPVGVLRRSFFKSIVKDEWIFFSSAGQEIGKLIESSILRAVLSRFTYLLLPQKHAIFSADGRTIAEIRQHFNLFVLKYSMTILEPNPPVDRRLLIAAGVLMASKVWARSSGGGGGP